MKAVGRGRCFALLLFAGTAAPIATIAAEQTSATIEQPRSFGYVIGDVVTQRILMPDRFMPADLTTPQRLGLWFERRGTRTEVTSDGSHWLIVDYQLTNAPRTLGAANLPAWTLESKVGAKLNVPAWSMNVSALIPENASPSIELLRPDRAAPLIPTAAMRARFHFALLALALVLVSWIAWTQWRNRRERANLPFAHALHEMRHLEDDAPLAWQTLHRAFDRAAGRVIQLENLPALFQRAPHLAPLRPDIEQFFTQSSDRFFGTGVAQESISTRSLCRELQRLEQRYAP